MRVLVIYRSDTGCTKKVAEAIFQELRGEKEIKPISQVNSLDGYDLTFIGSPMQQYSVAADVKDFLAQQAKGKDIALFITHSSAMDLPGLSGWLENCRASAAGTNLLGMFNCQGELSQSAADFMVNSGNPALVAWAKTRPQTIGKPDAASLKKARTFANDIVKKYSRR